MDLPLKVSSLGFSVQKRQYTRSLHPRDSVRLLGDHSLSDGDIFGVRSSERETKDLVADLELVASGLGDSTREFYSQNLCDTRREGVFACDRGRSKREGRISKRIGEFGDGHDGAEERAAVKS